MSTYSTYYTIMSMIDGFKSFINLAVMVLTIVASWIMYAKAGEHGWAVIVPFYSSYVKFRIAGKQKLFWGYLVASIASIAGCILLMYEIIASGLSVMTSSYMGSYYDSTYGYAGNRIGAHMGMLIFAVILIIAAMIAALVMNILCCVGLAHAFGKGAGFACGLIFLNVIFICIIAFNKNIVYVGDGYNSNNNYYNPYGSNGYGQQYGQNMYGNGANQQYGQNMYGKGAKQQYGQNKNGNGAHQQFLISSMFITCSETGQTSSTVRTCTEMEPEISSTARICTEMEQTNSTAHREQTDITSSMVRMIMMKRRF